MSPVQGICLLSRSCAPKALCGFVSITVCASILLVDQAGQHAVSLTCLVLPFILGFFLAFTVSGVLSF